MGSTQDYCRYTKALLAPYFGAIVAGGMGALLNLKREILSCHVLGGLNAGFSKTRPANIVLPRFCAWRYLPYKTDPKIHCCMRNQCAERIWLNGLRECTVLPCCFAAICHHAAQALQRATQHFAWGLALRQLGVGFRSFRSAFAL